jgi:hypothetical protein
MSDRPFWRRHAHRLVKHTGFITLAFAGYFGCRLLIPQQVLKTANEVGGNFLQTFGGMYGIIVAFAMFVVWQQHNDTQIALEKEAVSLGELYRVLTWFSGWAESKQVREMLERYAVAVPEQYLEPGSSPKGDEQKLLRQASRSFLGHAPANATEERLYNLAIDLFHELNEAREHRVTVAALRLPESLRWFLYLGAAFCVAIVWVLFVESWEVQALFTAGMTWVVVAAVSIVLDLDDPFSGDFTVNWARFRQTADQMREAVISSGPGPGPAPAASPSP